MPRARRARYVIAVNLNADMCGRGTVVPYIEAGSQDAVLVEANGVPKKNGRSAMKLLQRQFFGPNETAPGISTVVMDAFNIVQDRIARSRLAGDPPDFMISPRLAGIGPFDFHRAAELIERGTAAAQREVEDIARDRGAADVRAAAGGGAGGGRGGDGAGVNDPEQALCGKERTK